MAAVNLVIRTSDTPPGPDKVKNAKFLLCLGYPTDDKLPHLFRPKKLNLIESVYVYVPFPANVSGQKSNAHIRHSDSCGSSVMVSA